MVKFLLDDHQLSITPVSSKRARVLRKSGFNLTNETFCSIPLSGLRKVSSCSTIRGIQNSFIKITPTSLFLKLNLLNISSCSLPPSILRLQIRPKARVMSETFFSLSPSVSSVRGPAAPCEGFNLREQKIPWQNST